jgi:hypothetical protein
LLEIQIANSPVPKIGGTTTDTAPPPSELKSITSILETLHSPGRASATYDDIEISIPESLRTNVVLASIRSGDIVDKLEDDKYDSIFCIETINNSCTHNTDDIEDVRRELIFYCI